MSNFAALRAAVLLLSTKTSGGPDIRPPPVGARLIPPDPGASLAFCGC